MCECRIDSAPRRDRNRARVLRVDAHRGRLPRQIPPKLIEMDYGNALIRKLDHAFAAYQPVINELPALIAASVAAHSDRRFDAGEGRRAHNLVTAAAEHTRKAVRREDIEDLAREFAAKTSTYQRIQLGRQVKAVVGADPVFKDRNLAQASEQFVHENAALIVRIPEALHGDVEALVQRALSGARPSPKLAEHIEARFGVSKRHARLIARDQISKWHSKINHTRQRELGINKFQWDSVQDERVRDWHRDELDGNVYRYDNPPENEDGEPVLPGDDIQCRCSASPVIE